MKTPSKDKLVHDIENRLDDFFGEENQSIPIPSVSSAETLEKLKSVVLSIDWEITDPCLHDLISETERLLPQYENDRCAHALLRMLSSLGQYIRKRKAQSHPDAIKRIMSVFKSLETITGELSTNQSNKKKLVAREIQSFKKLKDDIEQKRSDLGIGAEGPDNRMAGISPGFVDHQKLEQAMNAVENRMRTEVDALKARLTDMQKELNLLRKKRV